MLTQSQYTSKGANSRAIQPAKFTPSKIKLDVSQRRERAKYLPCCWHCGATSDLIVVKRAGRDETICMTLARVRGLL